MCWLSLLMMCLWICVRQSQQLPCQLAWSWFSSYLKTISLWSYITTHQLSSKPGTEHLHSQFELPSPFPMLGIQNLYAFRFTSSIKYNAQCHRVCLFLPPSCHMWRLQCPTPSQITTLFMCFPPTWESSWDTSNAKPPWGAGKQGPPQRTSLKSFQCSSTKKTIPETCPVSIPSLTLINCRSLLPAKEVSLKTAKLPLSRSSERLSGAWLLCSPSPAATVPFLPVSNTSTEGELQVPLSLLPSPGFHSTFHHRDEDQETRVNHTKWGLTRGKPE